MQSRTFSSKVFVVLASLMIVGPARTVAADTLSLMWDANPEPAVTGYIVHVGTQPGASGVNILTVTALDAAGNTSSDVLTVSTAAATSPDPGEYQHRPAAIGLTGSARWWGRSERGRARYSATGLPPGCRSMPRGGQRFADHRNGTTRDGQRRGAPRSRTS